MRATGPEIIEVCGDLGIICLAIFFIVMIALGCWLGTGG